MSNLQKLIELEIINAMRGDLPPLTEIKKPYHEDEHWIPIAAKNIEKSIEEKLLDKADKIITTKSNAILHMYVQSDAIKTAWQAEKECL